MVMEELIKGLIIYAVLFFLFFKFRERTAKKALKSDRIFPSFADSIHYAKSQQDRIKRAIEQDLKVKKISSNGYRGKIIGTNGKVYFVTLKNCTCKDFKHTRKPCKHMYFLAAHTLRCNISNKNGVFELEKLN